MGLGGTPYHSASPRLATVMHSDRRSWENKSSDPNMQIQQVVSPMWWVSTESQAGNRLSLRLEACQPCVKCVG